MADLVDISGIGPAAKALLIEHGFTSVEKVAAATVAELGVVPGFGDARSQSVIDAANALLGGGKTTATAKPKKEKKKDKKTDNYPPEYLLLLLLILEGEW